MNNIYKELCKTIQSRLPGQQWTLDERFNTAAATMKRENEEKLIALINTFFPEKFDKKTWKKGGKAVKKIVKMIGLQNEQLLFLTDSKFPTLLFAAWWPWGDGVHVSLRIGIYSTDNSEVNTHEQFLKWFSISGG